ncbi:MAG: pantetheine-phosphate adenylyltransferase [Muribaculaceae bacterium]|nr:pantetheine-phosphate adenylyltransferase [Muribaculaceae bacterium]
MTAKYLETCPCERVALMAGTFNPYTVGHDAIVRRGLQLFDRIIIAVGVNRLKVEADPSLAMDAEARAQAIRRCYAHVPRVKVIVSNGLTVDVAREHGARFLLRGVRSVKDFEYERDMADLNRQLDGLETVVLYAEPQMAAVSSSAVRDIAAYGHDVSQFLP